MSRAIILLFGAFAAVSLSSARAGEAYFDFVRGLEQRGYYDYAILYLEQIEQRESVPKEIKQQIPIEKAAIYLSHADRLRNPQSKNEQLDLALAFLEQFVKENPGHLRSAEANTERARILRGKAKVEIIESRAPANEGTRGEFQKKARELIQQARTIFQTAYDQQLTRWEAFDKFIDRDADRAKFEDREQVELDVIRSAIDLALCTYDEAQTHDDAAPQRKELLLKAAEEFEQIHQKYRSMVGGLYARLWQGKCFEEQDDINKAMGFYNEILGHPGTSSTMRQLKNQTLHFRLISLNHESRKDHQLVIQEATEWLKTAGAAARSREGIGIRWEMTQAQEALADKRETSEEDRQRLLRQALENARNVNRFPGEYKDISLAMIQRLQVKLRGEAGDPEDFDTAFGLARQNVTEIKELKDKVDAAVAAKGPADEIQKLRDELSALLSETAHLVELALMLADDSTEAANVNQARYYGSYINLMRRKNYEAAILGEYVARTASKEESTLALDAAYLGLVAYVQAYNDSPEEYKADDIRFMEKLCNLITSRWPESDRANDARTTMGRSYMQLGDAAQAAEWYEQVPPGSTQYASSQILAGQAFWSAYVDGLSMPEEERPESAQLQQWQQSAQERLSAGITELQSKLPTEGESPAELSGGKMSLAQVMITRGEDAKAVELLTTDPHSVLRAIAVPDESQRPSSGVKGGEFASETYKLLLRAYIGVGDLEKARATMGQLEKVVGGTSGADVTSLYVEIGRQLEQELAALDETGQQDRARQVRDAFEKFLNDLYNRSEGQTFRSLNWIGETYFGLGRGSSSDPAAADGYFTKAADAFGQVVSRADEPNFMDPQYLPRVKIRLASAKREVGEFDQGREILVGVLKESPNSLDAQYEIASLYQRWAESGQGDTAALYRTAIRGNEAELMWGWGGIGNRLQGILEQNGEREDYRERFFDSRINVSESRRQLALTMTDPKEQEDELEKAERELAATVYISSNIPDDWFAKMNALYRQIQRDAGKPVTDLERPTVHVPAESVADSEQTPIESAPEQAQAAPVAPVPQTSVLLYVFLLLIVIGAAVGMYFMAAHSGRRRRRVPAKAGASPKGDRSKDKKRSRPAAASTKSAAGTQERKAVAATAAKPGAKGASQQKRPATKNSDPAARPRRPKSPPKS